MTLPDPCWPTSTAEEAYWQTIRKEYMIADDEIYLNTGSVGAQPRRVFKKMTAILKDVERSPIRNRAKHSGGNRVGRPAHTLQGRHVRFNFGILRKGIRKPRPI